MKIIHFLLLILPTALIAQTPAIYTDGHGGFVYFPVGDISFADVLVNQTNGSKMPEKNGASATVLGKADFDVENQKNFFTLGCGGSITVRFTNNALTDMDGSDLYIFEVGSDIEPTMLEISADGVNWINVGEINGGRADVDIHAYVKPGEVFYYVRLTDLKTGCSSNWPGADIDAIAAIGSVKQVTLNSSLMFDNAAYVLKPTAMLSLDSLAAELNQSSIKSIDIYGHTDNVGEDAYNNTLSLNRANAVKTYLQKKLTDKKIEFITHGMGESQPVASNETDEGKQQNRRVSMVVHPKTIEKLEDQHFEELTNVIYVAHNASTARWLNGYPKAVNKNNWANIYPQHLDDVFYMSGYSYFFNGNKVTIYDHQKNETYGPEQPINDIFPGVEFSRIDASIYLPSDEMICFFKNDSCILYRVEDKASKSYTLQELFPGLGTTHPKACVYEGNGNIVFFYDDKAQRYDYWNSVPTGNPVEISKGSWGNLWLTGPDGILDQDNGMIYFFKNPTN